jgi:Gas vesicle synthesis protein GvpL/GvpF
VAERDPGLDPLRAAIDRTGVELAPEVVARARSEALEKATAVLADAMARSLLEHARSHLSGGGQGSPRVEAQPAEPPRAVEPGEPAHDVTADPGGPAHDVTADPGGPAHDVTADPGELAHYVYGVTWADEIVLPAGLGGVASDDPPFVVEHGKLGAIASLVPLGEFGEEELHENLNDVEWLEATARAHESVLDEAISSATVVPLRLCTLYRGEEQVREMLSRERVVFEDALRRLRGKAEWGVKLIAEPGSLESAAAADPDSDSVEPASPGAAYMRERSREARARETGDQIAADWADHVHRTAAAGASEALLNPVQNREVSGHVGEMLLNGVYLVDEEAEDEFRAIVDALADEYRERGASVELTGPWPAYNFVKGSIEAAR